MSPEERRNVFIRFKKESTPQNNGNKKEDTISLNDLVSDFKNRPEIRNTPEANCEAYIVLNNPNIFPFLKFSDDEKSILDYKGHKLQPIYYEGKSGLYGKGVTKAILPLDIFLDERLDNSYISQLLFLTEVTKGKRNFKLGGNGLGIAVIQFNGIETYSAIPNGISTPLVWALRGIGVGAPEYTEKSEVYIPRFEPINKTKK
jgi:hypothetical protein